MTTNHKPATALPWKYQAEGRAQFGILGSARLPAPHPTAQNNQTDAAYVAHAANAYPRLVEALRGVELIARVNAPLTDGSSMHKSICALLHDLGEEV